MIDKLRNLRGMFPKKCGSGHIRNNCDAEVDFAIMDCQTEEGLMGTAVMALGEVALRVNDLDASQAFYAETIGLELMRRFEDSAFFRIADGYKGHIAILALFQRNVPVEQTRTTIDHLAFTIAPDHYESELRRLENLGLDVTTAYHDWVSWRSLYVNDPDGNEVELVCADPEAAGDPQS